MGLEGLFYCLGHGRNGLGGEEGRQEGVGGEEGRGCVF